MQEPIMGRRNALKLGAFALIGGVCAFGIGSRLAQTPEEATEDDVSAEPPESSEPTHQGTRGYLEQALGLASPVIGSAGVGAKSPLHDTGIPLRVKYQYVLAACTRPDETFDHMYSDIDYQANAFYTQIESLQTLFATDDGDIVALVWPSAINGIGGSVCDWTFAADNDCGEVIDKFEFDPDTGVLRARAEDLPDHMCLQFQMMIRCDCSPAEITTEPWLTIENESSLTPAESGPVRTMTWDNVFEARILEPGQQSALTVDDLDVFINGLDREICFGDRAEVDLETGMLRIPLPAIGITEMRVRINEPKSPGILGASVARATRLSSMGFWNWMNGKLEHRDDLEAACAFNNVVHADKDDQIHPYMFNGYGFNITQSGDVAESAAATARLTSLVNFARANYPTYYAANIYTTLAGHANPRNASGALDPVSGNDWSQVLDPIRNTKAEIESFTSTLKARVDEELSGAPLGNVSAYQAVTHGLTLPSDKESDPIRNASGAPVDYYPTDTDASGNKVANESWWDPITNHQGKRDPVLVVSACTHARTQSQFTSADNNIKHWNYRGPVFLRILEVNSTASQPYVVISFFTPRRPYQGQSDQVNGQAAVTVLKFPLDEKTGDLEVAKVVDKSAIDDKTLDANRTFAITVTLKKADGTPISGTYGDMTFANGTCTINLKDGETKVARGVPAKYVWTVSEPNVPAGYELKGIVDAQGTIPADDVAHATVTNRMLPGWAKVNKQTR